MRDGRHGYGAPVRRTVHAALGRCPLCGSRGIWRSFGQLVETCPRCGYRFEREEGYWAGALIVNMTVCILVFFGLFVGGMLVTWPDVPWNGLLIATLVAIALTPVLLYPQSKLWWVCVDLAIHPYAGEERDFEG